MKKKIVTGAIGILILFLITLGVSFAYFTSNINQKGDKNLEMTAVVLASATMDLGEKVEAKGMYPGNKILKTVKVTGSGPETAKPIKASIILMPNVVDFKNHVKYNLYAVENSSINSNDVCESPKPTIEDGKYYDKMNCNTNELGTVIKEGIFSGREVVTIEIDVTAKTDTTYYLIVEYLNDEKDQNEEQGKSFTINIGFEASYEGPRLYYNFVVDGENVIDIPKKEEGYAVEVKCDDEKERKWNIETWSLDVEENLEYNVTCTINFKKDPIQEGIEIGQLAYDETLDNNLRYIGANPNNYVLFNEEMWRIIGWMNNIEDENGNKETRMKIIRAENIGSKYWSGSKTLKNNDWRKSGLQTYLNGEYYDSLTEESQKLISKVLWSLGGHSTPIASTKTLYTAERGTKVYSGRPTTWLGYITLMYPSDYGYAVGGDVRTTCLTKSLNDYNKNNCFKENWMYTGNHEWTITQRTTYADGVMSLRPTGLVSSDYVYIDNIFARPVLYLTSDVNISGGVGSIEEPFLLTKK